MDPTVTVRLAEPRDFDAWKPLWDGYNAFYGRFGATALTAEMTRLTWQRFFDEAEPMHAMVAQREGELIGLVHFLYHRTMTTVGPACYLSDLFTLASARGAGVGRLLIEAVYERAAADGASRVYWQTQETNVTAMRLYDRVAEKSGFLVYRKLL